MTKTRLTVYFKKLQQEPQCIAMHKTVDWWIVDTQWYVATVEEIWHQSLHLAVIFYSLYILGFHIVSSTGSLIYTEVTAFLKRQLNMITNYKSITTSSHKSLTLSADHLMYARKFHNVQFNPL